MNRWELPFGAWVKRFGVAKLLVALQTRPKLARQSVHSWVEGRTQPRPEHAQKMVDISKGEMSLEIIYAHKAQVLPQKVTA